MKIRLTPSGHDDYGMTGILFKPEHRQPQKTLRCLDLKASLCSLNSGVLETDHAFMCFAKWGSRIKMMNCSFEGGTGFRNGGAVSIFVSCWNHTMTM